MSAADSPSSSRLSSAQSRLHVYASIAEAEIAAAQAVADELRRVIAALGRASVIFASSLPATFFAELVKAEAVEWTRIIVFHTDEMIGLAEDAAQSARKFLINHLISRVPIVEFHGLRGEAANPRAVCQNYAAALASRPPDLAALNVSADGRLSLIDPFDLAATAKVRMVEIEGSSRRALSLTARALAECPSLFVIAQRELTLRPLLEDPQSGLFTQHTNAHFFSSR